QFQLKANGMNEMLDRLGRIERLLHLLEGLANAAPLRACRVEGNVCVNILEWLHVGASRGHLRWFSALPARIGGCADRPANAALDQVLKAGAAPGALIVAPRCEEHSSLALRPHPCPGLLAVLIPAVFQHGAVLFGVLRVDVGFIPALEAAVTLHDWVIGLGDGCPEDAGAVTAELCSNQLHVLRRVEEAVGSAVNGNETLAALDV